MRLALVVPSERRAHRAMQIGHDLLLALLEGIRVGE
jgi:hypothetical protein